MKTFDAGLAAHYELPVTTLATFLRVERRDGVVVCFNGSDRDVVVDGETYTAAEGLKASNLSFSSGASTDTAQLQIFPDSGDVVEADLLAGLWDFARYTLFEANYLAPEDGVNIIRRGWTGVADVTRVGFSIELRSLKQAWQQNVGAVTSKTCRARLGDDDCKVDLAPWTHDYVVSVASSRHAFTATGDDEAEDYFGDGEITFTSGPNTGYSLKVKSSAEGSGGATAFTLSLAAPFDVGVGDEFTAIAGCRKRLLEDCKEKFDNVLNFQGEPHVPGADKLFADPDVGGA